MEHLLCARPYARYFVYLSLTLSVILRDRVINTSLQMRTPIVRKGNLPKVILLVRGRASIRQGWPVLSSTSKSVLFHHSASL